MTTADQLLLKLQTGHGPFRVRKTVEYTWHKPEWGDDYEHLMPGHGHSCDATSDPLILTCECHGFLFCEHCSEHILTGIVRRKDAYWKSHFVRLP